MVRNHEINGETESKLREQFRFGARNAVVRRIWSVVQDIFYPNMSQAGIADRLQIARANVTRWKRGEMSFEALVAVLADCCKQWSDLPDRPPNEILRIAGLARMIGCLRNPTVLPDKWKNEEYLEYVAIVCCALRIMERQTSWRSLTAKAKRQSASCVELSTLTDEIIRGSDELFSRFLAVVPFKPASASDDNSNHQVPFRTVEDLQRIERDIADVWDVLDDSAPLLEDEVHA